MEQTNISCLKQSSRLILIEFITHDRMLQYFASHGKESRDRTEESKHLQIDQRKMRKDIESEDHGIREVGKSGLSN